MTATDASAARTRTTLDHVLYVLRDNPVTLAAFAMLAVILFCAAFGPALAPYDPLATDAARALQPPGAAVGARVQSKAMLRQPDISMLTASSAPRLLSNSGMNPPYSAVLVVVSPLP